MKANPNWRPVASKFFEFLSGETGQTVLRCLPPRLAFIESAAAAVRNGVDGDIADRPVTSMLRAPGYYLGSG
jgi:hypothetical protein